MYEYKYEYIHIYIYIYISTCLYEQTALLFYSLCLTIQP